MAIVISGVNNNDKITASDGTIDLLSSANLTGILTAPAFNASGNITAASINAGVATATTFVGNLTGNVNHTSNLLLQISGSEKLRIANSGAFGLNGTNYGTSGQVLTSQGSGSSPTWSTISVGGDTGIDFNDNVKIRLGDSQDLQIYHDSNHSYIDDAGTGNLRLRSGTLEITNLASNKTSAVFSSGGGQTLNFNNSTKFVTTNTGAIVTGVLTATSFSGDGSALTGTGVGSNTSINTTGIITATTFVPTTGQLSHRNLIINGGVTIHQRGGTHTHSGASSNYYGPDRFMHNCTGNGKTSIQQSTDAPNGFANSLLVTTTTQAATASSDIAYFGQYIEANNMTQLGWGASGATTATLSFYVKSSLQGNFVVWTIFKGSTASNHFVFTINNPNTWERKTITIPALTSGGVASGNGRGMSVQFDTGTGSAKNGTAGTWSLDTNNLTESGTVKLTANAGATLQVTGLQLEVGSVATPFEHRSFTEEELRCQRYYWKYQDGSIYGGAYGGTGMCHYSLPVRMRVEGTLTYAAIRTTTGFYNYSSDQLLMVQMSSTSPYITFPELNAEI